MDTFLKNALAVCKWALNLLDPTMTNSEKLYLEAKRYLDKDASPRNRAPQHLACVESVNYLTELATGKPICNGLNTRNVRDEFNAHPERFERLDRPEPGAFILSVSGDGYDPTWHGHVGIIGMIISSDGSFYVMSNNSRTGKWDTHMTVHSWEIYFGQKGFPVSYYKLKD